ncbi:rhodanese-like domain-containing protein [Candidatus Falkowbacteria bacterium]|nr:rhodanese-like domain-containing protein [Candidatus Falkowbacteria bacterium]MBT4433041.1 rhodanese-like domain-containing protein [Candidatus Falkowbacteria bacterium]
MGDVLRDDKDKAVDINYGLYKENIKREIDKGKDIYFLDIREKEEFEVGHIIGSEHKKYADIEEVDDFREIFSLNDDSFLKSLIIVYCHDGNRGLALSRKFSMENIKYLIGGVEALYNYNGIQYTGSPLSDAAIFDKKYQYKFQALAKETFQAIKENEAFIIDMRYPPNYHEKHIKGSISLKLNLLSTEEYNKMLPIIIKNKKIIIIAKKYSELFYANLLILRLERDYGFKDNQFYIIFNQFEEFGKDSKIEFEGSLVK